MLVGLAVARMQIFVVAGQTRAKGLACTARTYKAPFTICWNIYVFYICMYMYIWDQYSKIFIYMFASWVVCVHIEENAALALRLM